MKEEKDDIVIEDDPELSSPKGAEKKLREKLKTAEAKAKEYLDSWQRAQADFVNLRKRDEEAKQEFVKFANADFVEDLLPVLDSFSLALSHPSTSSGQVAKDIEPVYNQLMQVLKGRGLEELNSLGQTFDPKEHEAVGTISTDKSDEDHKILEVMQKGYILSGKIIRPAKVKIGEYKK
jgi:molecular chaperone GrpE